MIIRLSALIPMLTPLGTSQIQRGILHRFFTVRTGQYRFVFPDFHLMMAMWAGDVGDVFRFPILLVLSGTAQLIHKICSCQNFREV